MYNYYWVIKMKALVTGASNGIGKEMAIYLSELGYDLVVVSRSGDMLLESFLFNFVITGDDNVRIENVSTDIIWRAISIWH